jgi:hypothetical protein
VTVTTCQDNYAIALACLHDVDRCSDEQQLKAAQIYALLAVADAVRLLL